MKNNILIIAIVTIAALGVIAAVIIASVLNSEEPPPDSSGTSSFQSVNVPDSSDPVDASSDISDGSSDDRSSVPADSGSDSSDSSAGGSSEAERIIATANSLIGVPFAENGSSPDGFDNSGFIYYVLRENGYITCPRGTEAQARMGARLEYNELKVGDLVFFTDGAGGDTASVGGIYIGGGKMIACMMPGTLVREVDISVSYYRDNFFGGVSLT